MCLDNREDIQPDFFLVNHTTWFYGLSDQRSQIFLVQCSDYKYNKWPR